ncbi:Flp family type IVb pilin [Phenylobacterium sp.]|jgi:pilus assembly protein Flp/PilA|uniref:Flp family type IVb pilin n=1 Tax=Phenylobacterium sp. TaxID=1871053 RepID=UPI00378449EB
MIGRFPQAAPSLPAKAAPYRPHIDPAGVGELNSNRKIQPRSVDVLKTYIAATSQIENLKDRLGRDQSGAALIEYSILIGLITAVAVVAVGVIGTWVTGRWTGLVANLGLALP